MRVLLTTTSYQDTPGQHHDLLSASGFEIIRDRGPLDEKKMIQLIQQNHGFDGLLNGDDEITAKVIDVALAANTPLKVIAKYGIGLDSIDVDHATKHHIPVLFTPGVNHTTVAEHTFGLMVAVAKHTLLLASSVKAGQWKRETGKELCDKTLGILGMGRIGKEVIKRGVAFGMKPVAFDQYWDEDFAKQYNVTKAKSMEQVIAEADVLSLHLSLTDQTRNLLNADTINQMKDQAIVINTARGGLVDEQAIADACQSGKLFGYGTDVLNAEPMMTPHVFQEMDNIIVTPHVGSRTFESVERQALRATRNLVHFLNGDDDYIQANAK